MTDRTTVTIAYDCELRRPGCVLLQAALGATISNALIAQLFEPQDWLTAPTAAMRVYRANPDELRKLAAITAKHRKVGT